MRGADVYYGTVAEAYDASREVKPKWKAEQAAVDRFLTDGPVLDVPFGTGRFVPIYRAKGFEFTGIDLSSDMLAIARRKYPGVNARVGSAFDLDDDKFATAVCVRFLEWLPLEQARVVINRLRRIAPTLILTITHGIEGEPEAFTYDFNKFLGVIDGLMIEDRQVTAHVRGMVSEVFKLRPASWSDVLEQFSHDGEDAAIAIQRIADKHAGFFGLPSIAVNESTATVRAEYWSGESVGVIATILSFAEPRFLTSKMPRRIDGPLTILERDGVILMLDGRHRANVLKTKPGPHPVLVIRV